MRFGVGEVCQPRVVEEGWAHRHHSVRILQRLHVPDLQAREAGGSERQWQDLCGLLGAQKGRLDLDYLRRWAPELGAGALLEKAFAET